MLLIKIKNNNKIKCSLVEHLRLAMMYEVYIARAPYNILRLIMRYSCWTIYTYLTAQLHLDASLEEYTFSTYCHIGCLTQLPSRHLPPFPLYFVTTMGDDTSNKQKNPETKRATIKLCFHRTSLFPFALRV